MKVVKNLGIFALMIVVALFVFDFINKQNLQSDTNSVPVYLVRNVSAGKSQIIQVRRPLHSGESQIASAIAELLKGPTRMEIRKGYYSEIPETTTILEIEETQDNVTINLSKDFESGGGSASMETRLQQLANTSLDTVKDKPVYLELDGIKVDYVGGEGVEVPQPLSRKINKGQDIR
jgi:spore germination protein GerM